MFVCNQVQLIPFQKARSLSESAQKKHKTFRKLKLTADEEKKLQSYSKMDISSFSECNLVEFQELYCKQQLFEGINSGKFHVKLEFTTDIHSKIRDWLKNYGYYLCPDKPINHNAGWLAKIIKPTPESTTKFDLRW